MKRGRAYGPAYAEGGTDGDLDKKMSALFWIKNKDSLCSLLGRFVGGLR